MSQLDRVSESKSTNDRIVLAMGNHPTKHQTTAKNRPKKNVHWKSAGKRFSLSRRRCSIFYFSVDIRFKFFPHFSFFLRSTVDVCACACVSKVKSAECELGKRRSRREFNSRCFSCLEKRKHFLTVRFACVRVHFELMFVSYF